MEALGVAIADENERARTRLEHVGEILSAQHRRHVGIDPVRPCDLACHGHGEVRFARMVIEHRIAPPQAQARRRAMKPRRALDHFGDPLGHEFAHLGLEGPRRAAQFCGLRDDVVGGAGLKDRDRHHRRLDRIDIARHDRLQRGDHLPADHDGIDARLGSRRMGAAAFDLDVDAVGRGHDRSRPDRELPERQPWEIVHAVDLVDGEAIHQAVLHHRKTACPALLRRLEDHDGGAGEITGLGEILRGTEQHRGVAVVPAGMHLAGDGRFVGKVVRLLDRQRVHVGTQPDHLG